MLWQLQRQRTDEECQACSPPYLRGKVKVERTTSSQDSKTFDDQTASNSRSTTSTTTTARLRRPSAWVLQLVRLRGVLGEGALAVQMKPPIQQAASLYLDTRRR
eukprot:scaffold64114_cov45-Phaeocystis_antarctica.AAC.2